MRKEGIVGLACAVLVALLCSCFTGTVMATTEKAVLFSDSFDDDSVDWDAWDVTTTADKQLYDISTQNELEVSAYDTTPTYGADNIYTVDGYTNSSLDFSFTIEKISNTESIDPDQNTTYIWGAVTDLSQTDVTNKFSGMLVGVLMGYSAYYEWAWLYVAAKDSDYEADDLPAIPYYSYDVEPDTVYLITINLDRVADVAIVSVTDPDTEWSRTVTIPDLYETDADTELGLAFGGSVGIPDELNERQGMVSGGICGFPPVTPSVSAYTPVGYIDNAEISTQVTVTPPVTPPTTPITDRSKDIAWGLAAIGVIWLLAAGFFWIPLREKRAQWLMTFIGIVWLVLAVANYYYGWIKTIPYIAQ